MGLYVTDILLSVMLTYPLTILLMGILLFLTYFLVGKAQYLIYLSIAFVGMSLGIGLQIAHIPENVPLNVTLSGICFLIFSYFIAQGIVALEGKVLDQTVCFSLLILSFIIRCISGLFPNTDFSDFIRVFSVYSILLIFLGLALWNVRRLIFGDLLEKIWCLVITLWVISLLWRLAYLSYSPEMLRILFVENKNPFYENFYILQHIFYILVLIFSILTLLLAIKRLIRDTNEKRLFDALTGAYNRLGLQHFIEFDLPKLNTFSLIMLDIDFFKSVNSQYGHPIGDSVIKILVHLIKTNMNSEDSKVIRLGGEEFMVILPSFNQRTLMRKSEYLREAIEKYDFSEIAEGLMVTVSMGVGEYDATIDFQDIYTDIDRKLAEAKRNGRNQIVSVINS